jgi:hypothetical protein
MKKNDSNNKHSNFMKAFISHRRLSSSSVNDLNNLKDFECLNDIKYLKKNQIINE